MLRLHRNGAVGFIDWLGRAARAALRRTNKTKKRRSSLDIFKNLEIEHLHELSKNLIRAKPRRVIVDSRRDD
jgi:hypothetical protein